MSSPTKMFDIYDCEYTGSDGGRNCWVNPSSDCITYSPLEWAHTPELLISNQIMSMEEYFDAIGPKPLKSKVIYVNCNNRASTEETNDTMGRIIIAAIRHSLIDRSQPCSPPNNEWDCTESSCSNFWHHYKYWIYNEFNSGEPFYNLNFDSSQESLDNTISRLLMIKEYIRISDYGAPNAQPIEYLFDRILFRQEYSKYVSAHKAHINSRLIEKIQKNDSDRIIKLELEIKQLKSEKTEEIEQLKEQLDTYRNTIELIQNKLDAIERKYTPELIEYNYDEIKARLDPIRSELKMTQRIFARIIRAHYEAPLAISVLPTKCT